MPSPSFINLVEKNKKGGEGELKERVGLKINFLPLKRGGGGGGNYYRGRLIRGGGAS